MILIRYTQICHCCKNVPCETGFITQYDGYNIYCDHHTEEVDILRKKLFVIIAIISLFLSGCSWTSRPRVSDITHEKTEQQTKKTDNRSPDTVQNEEKAQSSDRTAVDNGQNVAKNNSDVSNNSKDNGKLKSNEVSNQPGYDNNIIGWGLKQNIQKPPEVPASWINMLKKYNGYYIGDITKKEVYLTFDEGYEAGNTAKILDILKANDVKAAFFVTGHFVKTQPDLVIRMIKEGHVVGNHTVNHPSMPTISNEKIKEELDGVQEAVYKLANYKMKYMRPPKGEFNERTLSYTNQLGYKTIFWSLALADWQPLPGGPEESYNTVMKYLHPGAIILLHAVSKDDTEVLDRLLKDIKKQGYVFKRIDQLQ